MIQCEHDKKKQQKDWDGHDTSWDNSLVRRTAITARIQIIILLA